MSLEDLIRRYGDVLRDMSHADYVRLVQMVGDGPAVAAAVARARVEPESRFKNIVNYRVLRFLHQEETGELAEVDRSGLSLF